MNEESYANWLNGSKGFELRDTNHYITQMNINVKIPTKIIQLKYSPFIQKMQMLIH